MEMYHDNQIFGMHLLWWLAWTALVFWIFAVPYNIPGQRMEKDGPLDVLKKRLASGEISDEEYKTKKELLSTTIS